MVMGQDMDAADSAPTSDLNAIDFLQAFSGAGYENNGEPVAFNTFLSAIQTTGLTGLLTNGSPYLLLAPADAAYAALPKEKLTALLADPKDLAVLLRSHMVAGYIPRGSLAKTPGGPFNRSLTNLMGMQVTIGDGFTINGTDYDDMDSYFIANGGPDPSD